MFDLVKAGEIGDVRKMVTHFGHFGPKEIGVGPEFMNWLGDPKLGGGGALYDFGCYGADLVTVLMGGQKPLTVTAVTQQIKPDIYPKVDDEATIILTYPKAQAILQASWNWPFGREDVEVYGKTGYVLTAGAEKVRERKAKEEERVVEAKKVAPPYDDELTLFAGGDSGWSEAGRDFFAGDECACGGDLGCGAGIGGDGEDGGVEEVRS